MNGKVIRATDRWFVRLCYMAYGISIQTFSHCVWWWWLMCCHGVLFLLHISSSYYKQLITICALVELQSSPSFPFLLYPKKHTQICLCSEFWSLASNSCLFCLLDATSYGSGELKMKKKKTNALPPFHPLLQIVSLHIGAVSHSLQHWHVSKVYCDVMDHRPNLIEKLCHLIKLES